MKYSILINTCDKFNDCWNPFFKLWSIYWKDCSGKIYLNTEYQNFSYPGIDITSTKVCQNHNISLNKRATWSQCLKWALETMDTDIVLYMQEDYFLKDTVKNEFVERYVYLMLEHPNIKCIHLTDQAVHTSTPSTYENLDNVPYHQRYRVSCQTALWRKDELLNLIRDYENAWEFEEFGSDRSKVMKQEYLAVSKQWVQLNRFEIIPYIFTGIVQSKWLDEVVPLFEKHDIKVNYQQRGFLSASKRKPVIERIKYRLNKIPKIIRHRKDLNSLKKEYE
ncbi:hypothetical protein [uncultured Alistipes sp.]|jgi:hypothetical protein|uniref:hypothetical protein n=1 Tax=uncultured Alistipes sp. TaxID=538949 RepID=UPI0026005589|nr:hypothetical protein [uncultured Alistipes sp.]